MDNINLKDLSSKQIKNMLDMVENMDIKKKYNPITTPAHTLEEALQRKHKFWKTQPVPHLTEDINNSEAIEKDKSISEIKDTPYALPNGFEWSALDLNSQNDTNDMIDFLNMYYVEDSDNTFRLNYTPEFLIWSLTYTSSKNDDLIFCARVSETKKMVGLITGVIIDMCIKEKEIKMADIDYLCIHPKLRNKGMASLLIKEVTRRVNKKGYFQAIYGGTRYLPKPICTAKYYHRPIDVKKLIETGFLSLPNDGTLDGALKFFSIESMRLTNGFRPLEEKDIDSAFQVLADFLTKYDCYQVFNKDTFTRIFYNNPHVTAFVIEKEGEIVDFASYYKQNSKVLKPDKYEYISEGYLYYTTNNFTTLYSLGKSLLLMAQMENLDVFNVIDIMDNIEMIDSLRFTHGTGILHYYLFNWKFPETTPSRLAKYIL